MTLYCSGIWTQLQLRLNQHISHLHLIHFPYHFLACRHTLLTFTRLHEQCNELIRQQEEEKFLYPGISDVDAALGALPVPSSDTIMSTPSPPGSQVAVPFRSTRQN
jgi:hypothetical protein